MSTMTPVPAHVIWDVTYACPLRCCHCYSESGRRPSRQLDAEARSALADRIIAMGPSSVAFSGGEPLLVPDVLALGRRMRAAGIHVRVYTSGSQLSDALAAQLAETASRVHVSVDAGRREIHDRVRGRAGSFDTAMSALERLSALRRGGAAAFDLVVDTSLLKSSLASIPELCSEISRRDLAITALNLAATIPVGLASREEFAEAELLTMDELVQLSRPESLAHLRSLLPPAVKLVVQDYFKLRMAEQDLALHASVADYMHIEPDGAVRAIPIYEGTVGALLTEDAEVIWRRVQEHRMARDLVGLLEQVRSPLDWARAARTIDLQYAAPAERDRIARRPVYVPELRAIRPDCA